MTLIDHMVSYQTGFITKFTGAIAHTILWADTVFVYHYSNYCHYHLLPGNSAEETLKTKEASARLVATHVDRVYTYRPETRRFSETRFRSRMVSTPAVSARRISRDDCVAGRPAGVDTIRDLGLLEWISR